MALLDHALRNRLGLECRYVDEDIAIIEPQIDEIPDALVVHAQLREARGNGDVHRLDRRTVDASADAQTVTALEAPDAGFHHAVEIVGAESALRAHVAPQNQDAPHRRDALVVIAGPYHA